MASSVDIQHRFPGLVGGWARFDGPAGTQMVDSAIRAMTEFASSGSNANTGGYFAAANESDALLERTRGVLSTLFGADPEGICLGANMTTMTMALTRAIAQTLQPGDLIVGTKLDHDANVSPWRIACEMSGAEHKLAPFSTSTFELDTDAMIALITPNTKWVAITGASNLLGTAPNLRPIIDAAHNVGARVFVDAVHLAVHRQIDIKNIGCDVLATSPYKWYGPHAGVLCVEPELLNSLPVAKVRPAKNIGPGRFETGTPNFEGIAAVEAAARFLLEEDMNNVESYENSIFLPLLNGLQNIDGVKVWGRPTLDGRVPTVSFTIRGHHPDHVAQALAQARIAVWSGSSYAVEAVEHLGLTELGGVVRAGVTRYVSANDVDRLLEVVTSLASNR